MCDFDDFDDGFDCEFDDDFSEDVPGGIKDESAGECEGFWDLDTADFAIIGGVIGYLEEEIEERKRLERELKKETEKCESCCEDRDPYDPYDPPDEDQGQGVVHLDSTRHDQEAEEEATGRVQAGPGTSPRPRPQPPAAHSQPGRRRCVWSAQR